MTGPSVVDRHVAAPVDVVAAVLADPRTYDGLVVGSRRVRWFDPTWPAPGARLHHTVGFGPVTIRDHTEVLHDALPDRLELAAAVRPIGVLRVVFTLRPGAAGAGTAATAVAAGEAAAGAGTRVEMLEEPLSGPVVRLWSPPARRLTDRRNAVTLRRLDELARDRDAVRRRASVGQRPA
ncbi:MAG TPA: hypothetical protein VF743_00350 [Acidimicrobiales bacterium]